jgi:hypothetical protein
MVRKVSDLEEKVKQLESRLEVLENKFESGAEPKTNSIKEFVNEVDPEDHDQTFIAIGYYLENKEGENEFTTKEAEQGYKRAKRNPYSNFSVLTNRLEDKDLIMEMGEKDGKKSWALTNKGEHKINDKLENE